MSAERYPADLKVSPQDFAECGWKEAIQAALHPGYFSISQAFRDAANLALQGGLLARGKVLCLLEEACSMMLAPESMNEPYKPYAQFQGRRSKIPDDFSKEEIEYFAQIVPMVDDVWLKARLADLVWLLQRPRQIQFALDAIDAYRSIPLEPKVWVADGGDCWRRAFMLVKQVRTAAEDRRGKMRDAVYQRFDGATAKDGFLGSWLSELLDGVIAQEHCKTVAAKLDSLASAFLSEGDVYKAKEYLRIASQWYGYAQIWDKATDARVALAECWIKEAEERAASTPPSHSVAREFYEQAIQVFRTIPKRLRTERRIDERIAELLELMKKSGEKALGEMKVFRTPEVDISDLARNARDAVKGKNVLEALREFANLRPYMQAEKLREAAIERLHSYAFRAFFPTTHFGGDGRVVAKQSGVVFAGGASEEEQLAIRVEMISEYMITIGFAVRGGILPALEEIRMAHRLREVDFRSIAHRSAAVPPGRECLWGKALYAGYDGDFCVALHMLVPQIEHMVRTQLKTAGAQTATLDSNGIETENGLSTLMDLPEALTVFGPDVWFELKHLFCDAFGPNLRNELSHGLLNDDICGSDNAIYAWWLAYKMVFNNFWSAIRQHLPATSQNPDEQRGDNLGGGI